MRVSRLFALLLVLAGLAACGAPTQNGANDGVAADNAAEDQAANATNVAATVVNAMNDAVPGASPTMVVEAEAPAFDRLGAIRIGATLGQLARDGLAVDRQDEPLDEESTCTYATFKGRPDIAVMLDGARIARIDVSGKQHETIGGVRIGQSEAEALKRLGGKAKVEPHPYEGPEGHYLVVHEAGAPRGLILETDGKTVRSWRFGQWEQVQWIEGCA